MKRKIPTVMSYKEIAIKQLEFWGWDVERYRLYGLPWYLKFYLYPIIWGIKQGVEVTISRLVSKNDESNIAR